MNRIVAIILLAAAVPSLSSCGLILLAVLPGCDPYTVEVGSNSSDDTFAGSWTGVVHDFPAEGNETPLVLDVNATYLDQERYEVDGTFQIGARVPLAFEGEVDGGCAQRFEQSVPSAQSIAPTVHGEEVEAQTQPPSISMSGFARDGSGAIVWDVSGRWYGGPGDEVDVRLLESADGPGNDPFETIVILRRADPS